ncbi:MAG: hypothetical protein SNJ82_07305, partial [Gemmataceae bacterium]
GVVAIPANTNHWPSYHREEAHRLMRLVCPNGYTILHEEEVTLPGEGKPQREYRLTFRSNVQVPSHLQSPASAEVPQAAPPGLPPRPVPIAP